MAPEQQEFSLDGIRREIDAIDDGLLDLIGQRIAASERVRATKSTSGALTQSPIRPAREALILRRLLANKPDAVPADILVRLWRVILSSSTLAQAPVIIHLSQGLAAKPDLRVAIAAHFGATPLEEHDHEAAAIAVLQSNPGDISVVEPQSPWIEAFMRGLAGDAWVIGLIPALRQPMQHGLLILGHAQTQPTGDDETLVASSGSLPRDFSPSPLWQLRCGQYVLSSLPGYLNEGDGPLAALMRSNSALGLRIAGRYPSPIEVTT